jgi:hypothetical protein
MSLVHWILDIAALLLWIDWRSGRVVALKIGEPGISITNSIRPTDKFRFRGWGSLIALVILLLLRPFLYTSLGTSASWTPRINLLVLSIPWRTDLLGQMFAFSLLSFGCALAVFYSWLFLLNSTKTTLPENDLVVRFIKFQLGWTSKLPALVKLLIPLLGAGLCWAAAAPLLQHWQIIPNAKSVSHNLEQAALFCVAALLLWRWLFLLIFAIHFINLYVYLGTHPFWNYMSQVGATLLWPLKWFRFGRVDLSPILGAAVVFLACEIIQRWVISTFERLPL